MRSEKRAFFRVSIDQLTSIIKNSAGNYEVVDKSTKTLDTHINIKDVSVLPTCAEVIQIIVWMRGLDIASCQPFWNGARARLYFPDSADASELNILFLTAHSLTVCFGGGFSRFIDFRSLRFNGDKF